MTKAKIIYFSSLSSIIIGFIVQLDDNYNNTHGKAKVIRFPEQMRIVFRLHSNQLK